MTEAEEEAATACRDFSEYKATHGVGMATYELGELRLRRGDLAGAGEAFRRALEGGVEPQPGLALLRLAEGKPHAGFGELERALADVPGDRMERARLLPAYIELAAAAGELEKALDAAEELASLAALFNSDALTATAASARGLVLLATADASSAVAPLRESVRRWHALGVPYEAARARTALAEAYQAIGDDDAAVLELEAARSIFERLGAVAGARRVEELLRPGRASATTATFLFSDISGSTSLVESIGDEAWLHLVEWHDRMLRALFAAHEGEEVDHAGDGFFVAFPDPAAAVACAVAIQRALAEHPRQNGFAPPVRIGVHTTEAIRVGGAYRGKGIHAASRIGAQASANEIVASRETADAGRVGFTNPRALELKGLSTPVEVVTIDWT
jgi:class 3 adenylate cyclase